MLAALEKNEIDSSDCSRALLQISNILENTMGGTSGALYWYVNYILRMYVLVSIALALTRAFLFTTVYS